MGYGRQLAEVYEMVFRGRGKDWPGEADDVARIVRSRLATARSLLDVGCGTGAHLARFKEIFEHVEGLELSAPMRELAERRLAGHVVHEGDMRDFDLGRTFDAVCSMFSAIGYVRSTGELDAAVGCMARHLRSGGVLVVEPWWFPESFADGYVAADMVSDNGRTVARMSHSTRHGDTTRMRTYFLVAGCDGITAFDETDLLTMFTRTDYTTAFDRAGCPAEYLEGGPCGRGLFVGIRR